MCLETQQPAYMHKTLKELGIGTYKNIAIVSAVPLGDLLDLVKLTLGRGYDLVE